MAPARCGCSSTTRPGSRTRSATWGTSTATATLDIVSVNTFSGDIVLLAGRGDGTFQPAGTFGTSINAQTPAVGDFNHDGRPDIGVPAQCPGLSGLLGNVCLAVLINRS